MNEQTPRSRFPSPYDVAAPAGAGGWQNLYPYFLTFRDNLKTKEEARFWFCDSQHWPNVFRPFETITVEFACKCLGQYNTRHYMIPPANGIDYRVHNGYLYMSPVAVPEADIGARVPKFLERAGYYFQNWDRLLDNWYVKVKANIADLESITFEPLPDEVPIEWIKDGIGLDQTYALITNYDKAIQLCYKAWQYHFEFLNLGYAAYLDFFGFCKQAFPDIPDQAIAKMVQGVDMELFRPDDELKGLAKLAVKLGIGDEFKSGKADTVLARLKGGKAGAEWLAAWEQAKYPWFNYTSGNGFYESDKYWIEHLDIPLGYVRDYIAQLGRGETIDRPTEAVRAERDRITEEYAALLSAADRPTFEGKLGLARQAYPYVENHNFYIEHQSMGAFWRKMRELSRIFHKAGFFADPDDMFYLRREEVSQALFDYSSAWAVGAEPIGPTYWPLEVKRRRAIVDALKTSRPEPALNKPPEVITEPFTIMLWGITSERVAAWLGGTKKGAGITGMAASPGIVEGIARIINNADQLDDIQVGDILVAPVTAPSWGPVFGKIKATVTDIGGIMSHAAIVCREYGLPAVTGTGTASTTIRNGQRIRVNGSTGEVTILQ